MLNQVKETEKLKYEPPEITITPLSTFSENIKRELQRSGKSTYWLARKSGVSQSLISNYLNGKTEPSLSKALAIANALRIPLSQLTDDEIFKKKLLPETSRDIEFEQEVLQSCSSTTLLQEVDRRLNHSKKKTV